MSLESIVYILYLNNYILYNYTIVIIWDEDISASCVKCKVISIQSIGTICINLFNLRHYFDLSGLADSCSLSFARKRRRKHRNTRTLGSRPGITVSFLSWHEEFNPFLYWMPCWKPYVYGVQNWSTYYQNCLFIQSFLVVTCCDYVCQGTAKCRCKRSWYMCRTLQ